MNLSPVRGIAPVRFITLLAVIAGPLRATTVVEDSFTDGMLVGGSDAADVDWFAGSASSLSVVDDAAGLAGGNALQMVAGGTFARATAQFSTPLSIATAGDRLVLTMKLRMTRFSVAHTGGLRFGLHHHNGSPVNAMTAGNGWTANTEGWEGYYFRGGVGGEAGMRIFRDLDNAGNSALGGSGDVTVGNGTAWAIDDNDAHRVRIEIERQGNAQNTLRFHWDDELQQETSTAIVGGEISEFTNVTFGAGATELDLIVDDITVTLTNSSEGGLDPIDLDARLIDWKQAGVQGGIPTYANTIDFAAAGGDGTGLTDNSDLLQTLIDGLTEDTIILFAAGTFRFDDRINFANSSSRELPGVIIRGAGTHLTRILFQDPAAEDAGLFHVTGYNDGGSKSISGGLTKESTALALDSVSNLAAGDWLWIRQDNDPEVMATIRDIPGYAATIDNRSGWAARVVGQVVQIRELTAGGVIIEQPLHLDFTWPNPTAQKLGPARGIGFEDFTLDNGLHAAGRFNFDFARTVNCWIQNVHSLRAVRSHVAVAGSANLEVRDSYFNDAYRHDGGGHGYGVQLLDTTTHTLVVNNVFRNLRHAMIWKEGANGNVYGYNYSTDGNQEGSAVAKDISGHGHYAFGNLIEGNIAQFIHASDFWGPIGPNNMFLRNRTTEERILIEDGTRNQNILGNELVSTTAPFVVIDGTSTGAYVHGNNEGGALQWRDDAAQTVVASYYYAMAPSFWNISDPWPSMGPEQIPGTFTIPAKRRWDTGQMREFPVSRANGRLTNLSTRGQVLSGDDKLIAGFVIAGSTDQQVLLRGLGPVLGSLLDPDIVLDDPVLTVYRGSDVILSNDNWSDQPDAARVAAITAEVAPQLPLMENSRDAALVATLSPGAYTMHLSGSNDSAGIALAEVYDADGGPNAQLVNISTRGKVGAGAAAMIPGIVVTESSRRLLIRGVGPELAANPDFGLDPDTILPDPALTLTDTSNRVLATNDDWEDGSAAVTAEIRAVGAQVGAFPLSSGGGDAALLVTLPPGVYTAQVTDANAAEGIAIVEVYAVTE